MATIADQKQRSYETVAPESSVRLQDRIPLKQAFRYIHEPLLEDAGSVRLLGARDALDGLKKRIRYSNGGSFLVTGFRGTGKTTVILRMLDELEESGSQATQYLPIVLNVARPMSLDELLFEVVRRLFEALIDRHILEELAPDVRRALVRAYARTSLSFKETRSESTERSRTFDLGAAGVPLLSDLAPKLGLSRKHTDSLATEASFLTYSHGDVEHDFLRILDLLNRAQPGPVKRWQRLRWRLRGGNRKPWQGRVVVVLDELDKLPSDDPTVSNLLSGLKNILSTRNVHFIFVGGPDLHDAALLDASRGESVYESVFAYQVYVPCLWQAGKQLLEDVLREDAAADERELLQNYLDYKARGVPRLLLRELNDLVRWNDAFAPYLHVDDVTRARVSFYARLQDAVNAFAGSPDEEDVFTLPIDRDRWRLGTYYITDWVLRNRRRPFTLSEILDAKDGAPSAWLKRAAPEKIQELLNHLVNWTILRVAWDTSTGTIIGDAPQERTYEIEPSVLDELSLLARHSARERADLHVSATRQPGANERSSAEIPWSDSERLGTIDDGRYILEQMIARGGIGTVYRAHDRAEGREVAVKVLDERLAEDETVRLRFRREAKIATLLSHPNIVTTYGVVDEPDQPPAIVMNLIEGESLRAVLPVPAQRAIEVASDLLDGLQHLHEVGMVRVDLKPDNIIINQDGHAVLVDLGIVKPEDGDRDFDTVDGTVMIGTPAYMSPEQIQGGPLSIASDIFALGVVLFEMLSGEKPFGGNTNPASMLFRAIHEDVDTSRLKVSDELRSVIARAMARDPDDRFPSPIEMRAALLGTPEAIQISGPAHTSRPQPLPSPYDGTQGSHPQ